MYYVQPCTFLSVTVVTCIKVLREVIVIFLFIIGIVTLLFYTLCFLSSDENHAYNSIMSADYASYEATIIPVIAADKDFKLWF